MLLPHFLSPLPLPTSCTEAASCLVFLRSGNHRNGARTGCTPNSTRRTSCPHSYLFCPCFCLYPLPQLSCAQWYFPLLSLPFPFGLAFLPHRVGVMGASRRLSLIPPAAILSAALFDENATRRSNSSSQLSSSPVTTIWSSGAFRISLCIAALRRSSPTVHGLPTRREHGQCHIPRCTDLDPAVCPE